MTLRTSPQVLDADAARLRNDVVKVRRLANSFLVDPADRPEPVSEAVWLLGIGVAVVLAIGLIIGCAVGSAAHQHAAAAVQCVFIAGVGVIAVASKRPRR